MGSGAGPREAKRVRAESADGSPAAGDALVHASGGRVALGSRCRWGGGWNLWTEALVKAAAIKGDSVEGREAGGRGWEAVR